MNTIDKGYTYDPEDIARTTIKETNIHNNTTGNMNTIDKGYTYDPEDIARTTIKETNIHNEHNGHIGNLEGLEGGYTTNIQYAPNTNRQFSTDEYTGIMNGDIQTGGGKGYLTTNTKAQNTNRQTTTIDYTGSAESNNPAPMSYSDIYNMTLNDVKETTLVNRERLGSNVTISAGKNFINNEDRKLERENKRETTHDKIYSNNKYLEPCSITKTRKSLDIGNSKIIDRIEANTLDTFNNNPFTHKLDSHAFN